MQRTLSLIFVGLACSGAAAAQTLDYDGLQQLFGEPVTQSVTGSPQRESDVAASMEIIDADEIRRSGARDLPGLLRHVAGVDVLQTTMSHADVSVRGYNQAFAPRLLVLLDGRQVYADYYGFTPWDAIPVELEAIRQIEVVRGPNSALFGFNAVGGVVNIITYGAAGETPSSATALAGTQGLKQLSAVYGWEIGEHAGIRLSVGRRDNDDFDTPQRPFDVGTRRGDSREAVNVAGAFNLTDGIAGEVEAARSEAPHTEIGPVYASGFTTYDTESIKARLAADTRIGLVEGSFYTNDIVAPVFNDVQAVPFLVLDNEVRVAHLRTLSKIGPEHTLRLSAERRDTVMKTTPIGQAEVLYDVSSFSAMWEWQLASALTLTNALRFDSLALARHGATPPGYPLGNDYWDRTIDEHSFNSGVVWRLSSTDVLRFMVARGAQLPSLFNLGGLVIELPPAGFVTGVPTLEPTIVTNYEVGWRRELPGIGGALRVSAFRGRTLDIVSSIGGSNFALGLVGTPANIGDSHLSGLEIAVEGASERWHWGASFTPISIHDEFDPGFTVATTQTEFEHTTPRRVLNGNVGWTWGPWEADAYLRYESRFQGVTAPDPSATVGLLEPVASYASIDARLGYRLNERMTFAIAGQGLGHDEQRQTASGPSVERRVFASIRVAL
jgi:iron complex outermembrane receptor protein